MKEILKYNTLYQYFGEWTPRQLHDAYEIIRRCQGVSSFTIDTGKISVDDICNTLWNEMSYNPLRFGKRSPFVFHGVNSIESFCNYYDPGIKDIETVTLLATLRKKLKRFLALMDKYDPEFVKTGVSKNARMTVKMQEYSLDANTEYQILACLVACIHAICIQNVKDYENKPSAYRAIMAQVCSERHPNHERKNNDVYLAKANSLKQQQRELLGKISEKNNEIMNIQTQLDTLSEYGTPNNSAELKNKMEKLQKQLKPLEIRLEQLNAYVK